MTSRELIRRLSQQEPLNPYQVAGMAAVIDHSGVDISKASTLEVDQLTHVLMLLDRTGAEGACFLVGLDQKDSRLILFPRFPKEKLSKLVYLTGFAGRRLAIEENLIPIVYEIPNWQELVRSLARYALDRDNVALHGHVTSVIEIVSGYLYAAVSQPFDKEASKEAEYVLARLAESILKLTPHSLINEYLPFLEAWLVFLLQNVFPTPINPLERRTLEITAIRSSLENQPKVVQALIEPYLVRMHAQALVTELEGLHPCPAKLLGQLSNAVLHDDFPGRDRFTSEIIDRIRRQSEEEIQKRRETYSFIVEGVIEMAPEAIHEGISFINGMRDDWRAILDAFQELMEDVPAEIQIAFSELLAVQSLNVRMPEVSELLVEGICGIVLRLEKTRIQSSKDLVILLTNLFMDRAHSTSNTEEIVSCLKSVESVGVALGRNGYFLMAGELINHIVQWPLIRTQEKTFHVEDDDTGEPLVLAEDAAANRAHVQHIRCLLAIIASNPRIMYRLTPYLVVQMEFGGAHIRDEDLIQYWISCILRANASVTHFLNRTLIKAIPYSFKDIGPLDTLRITAAGLAKELANRGVKPIGNFLGKLRGDIHWQGSIENFYFCKGILMYFSTGAPEAMSDWMPVESMPFLAMDQWCSPDEARGIQELCGRVFEEHGINLNEQDSYKELISVDTANYRNDVKYSAFSRRVVLDVIDLLKGLHAKYFVVTQSDKGSTVSADLERFERILDERRNLRDQYLTPDIHDPMPPPVTLTEGSQDYIKEMERIGQEEPGTPIILRAKKAGHAYAQKATYIEERFEAFNKDLALESLQETIASSISNSHFYEITPENLTDALLFLDCLVQGVSVNGHSSYYLEQAGSDLRNSGDLGLTYNKVRDLLGILKSELDDIYALYRSYFEDPFDTRLNTWAIDSLPRKLRDLTTLKEIPETDFFKNYLKTLYISDLQARDGNLRVLETFVEKVELFLSQRLADSNRKVSEPKIDPDRHAPFYFPDQGAMSPCNIGLKASLLRFAENTPQYFVITTHQPLDDPENMLVDDQFRADFQDAVSKLELLCGKSLGDIENPAIFSVRSGSRVSLPGMMLTVTNVAINDQIAANLAEKYNPWFAYDSYRRFLQEFSQSCFGVPREEFQDIMDERKVRWRVSQKAQMTGDQMKHLAFDYKARVSELAPKAIELIDSGSFLEILIRCVLVVLHSYDGRAARFYRQAAGISGNWQTPAIVQSMVYGNIDHETSGTGVVSYNPLTLDLRGVFSPGDQGTDVVGGKVSTIPAYDVFQHEESLASRMPACWKQLSSKLYRIAERLHLHVNIEYTIEQGNAHILQIRKIRETRERLPSLRDSGYQVITQGTGVSGKIFRGILVTDRNQIAPYRHIAKAQATIDTMNDDLPEGEKLDGFVFVVNDPIPEEIMEEIYSLPVATALVSRLGGRGAHAADISKALDKVYVGQVLNMAKFVGRPGNVRLGNEDLVVGSKIIIHGQTGEIALYGKNWEGNFD